MFLLGINIPNMFLEHFVSNSFGLSKGFLKTSMTPCFKILKHKRASNNSLGATVFDSPTKLPFFIFIQSASAHSAGPQDFFTEGRRRFVVFVRSFVASVVGVLSFRCFVVRRFGVIWSGSGGSMGGTLPKYHVPGSTSKHTATLQYKEETILTCVYYNINSSGVSRQLLEFLRGCEPALINIMQDNITETPSTIANRKKHYHVTT